MIEKMDKFFEARVEGYDEHMLNAVEGCREGYEKLAEFLPSNMETLLDLGCGTGLELNEVFKRFPNTEVIAVDLTKAMLDKLKEKYPDKNIHLVNENYFNYKLEENYYDAVISFQTMHHFSHEDKMKLYQRIYNSLKKNGKYIECDYMVIDQREEDFYYNENKRLRREQGIKEDEFYHYDTPCTVSNEISMFKKVGFKVSKMVWRFSNTTIIENIKSLE